MFKDVINQLRPMLLSVIVLTLVTGLAYPLVVTAVSQVVFAKQANGSILERNGKAIGSTLIGQPFSDPKYFWGRLSATSPKPYDPTASSGSNMGPMNPALLDAVNGRIKDLKDADPDAAASVPVDLVTASASGLDPEISPAAALYQVKRVAKARNMDEAKARELIEKYTDQRQLGFLGEPRVNVLKLNLAFDEAAPVSPAPPPAVATEKPN